MSSYTLLFQKCRTLHGAPYIFCSVPRIIPLPRGKEPRAVINYLKNLGVYATNEMYRTYRLTSTALKTLVPLMETFSIYCTNYYITVELKPSKKEPFTVDGFHLLTMQLSETTLSQTKTFLFKNSGCYSCGGSPIKPIRISTGEDISLCEYCIKRISICTSCGFEEPQCAIRAGLEISALTGKNIIVVYCKSCSLQKALCPHCSRMFNPAEYNTCPCTIGTDFKAYIYAYNADVLDYLPKDQFSEELFGIEIEAGTKNNNRKYFPSIVDSALNLVRKDAILKYDSSIDWINKHEQIANDYKGFEVVTRPMIYKNTARFIKEFCKDVHPLLRSWEVGTCGLHIHVSKACLQPFEIGKILEFINNKNNRSFIKMIAKREDKRFAKFLTKKILDYRDTSAKCHYEAVNTNKPYTVEFRIFRGTLNYRTMLSYLQFVKSVVDFVKVTPRVELTHHKYKEFLFSTEKSRFRELKARIHNETTRKIENRGEI